MVDLKAFELLSHLDGLGKILSLHVEPCTLADLIEVDSFGYYDESKESATGYPQKRPSWILQKIYYLLLEYFLVWSAPH